MRSAPVNPPRLPAPSCTVTILLLSVCDDVSRIIGDGNDRVPAAHHACRRRLGRLGLHKKEAAAPAVIV